MTSYAKQILALVVAIALVVEARHKCCKDDGSSESISISISSEEAKYIKPVVSFQQKEKSSCGKSCGKSCSSGCQSDCGGSDCGQSDCGDKCGESDTVIVTGGGGGGGGHHHRSHGSRVSVGHGLDIGAGYDGLGASANVGDIGVSADV